MIKQSDVIFVRVSNIKQMTYKLTKCCCDSEKRQKFDNLRPLNTPTVGSFVTSDLTKSGPINCTKKDILASLLQQIRLKYI